MFSEYYQEELNFLREMGREFAEAYPAAAHLLAGPGGDPDVERLLEGVAFLTGRIREKLDDEFPELTHAMMSLMFPHYLRPVPAMTMVQFEPNVEALRSRIVLPRGTAIDSAPVEGTNCRFRTAGDVILYPMRLIDAALEVPPQTSPYLRLRFAIHGGMTPDQIGLKDLRLHLAGEAGAGYDLYLWLCRHVKRWTLRSVSREASGPAVDMPLKGIRPAGFSDGEALLPYPDNAFPGYRLLQEYFSLPEKFLAIDLNGLDRAAGQADGGEFEMIFELDRTPETQHRIGRDNVLLYCAGAVNLFSHDADPIRVDQERFEYPVRPSGTQPGHYEVYAIDRVVGFMPGTAEETEYPPFFSFRHAARAEDRGRIYFHAHLRRAVVGVGTTTSLSFVNVSQEGAVPPTEVVSVELTCCNGRLPEKLRPGDLRLPTSDSAGLTRFRNIGRISRAVPPPLSRNVLWLLMSHWSLNYMSLTSVEALRGLLALYNFHAFEDRQAARENELRMSAIAGVKGRPEERFYRGTPVRGLAVEMDLQESHFSGPGDVYLFGRVLHEFMARYVTMNSFVRLTVKGVEHRDIYEWPARMGEQTLL